MSVCTVGEEYNMMYWMVNTKSTVQFSNILRRNAQEFQFRRNLDEVAHLQRPYENISKLMCAKR